MRISPWPQHHEFHRGQAFQTDRAAGVELVGADADLAPTVLEAVSEAVEALIITLAESTSRMKRMALGWLVLRIESVWCEP